MRRSDLMQAVFADGRFRLDLHSAKYANLGRRTFTCDYYTIPADMDGRIDLITVQFYGNADLWWVIAFYNGWINPITEVTMGKEIKIPKLSEVLTALQVDSNQLSANQFREV